MASGIHAGAARLTGVQSRAIDTEDSSSGSRISSKVERYRVWLLQSYQSTLPGNIIRSEQSCLIIRTFIRTEAHLLPSSV
jgi:hypothetical protein